MSAAAAAGNRRTPNQMEGFPADWVLRATAPALELRAARVSRRIVGRRTDQSRLVAYWWWAIPNFTLMAP